MSASLSLIPPSACPSVCAPLGCIPHMSLISSSPPFHFPMLPFPCSLRRSSKSPSVSLHLSSLRNDFLSLSGCRCVRNMPDAHRIYVFSCKISSLCRYLSHSQVNSTHLQQLSAASSQTCLMHAHTHTQRGTNVN